MHESLANQEMTLGAGGCPNCGGEVLKKYCSNCGQKGPNPHDYELGHLAHETFHELFHVDGKIVRTLKVMFTEPGQLSLEHWQGRRVSFIGPLRLYIMGLALFFMALKPSSGLYDKAGTVNPGVQQLMAKAPRMQVLATSKGQAAFDGKFQVAYRALLVPTVLGLAWFLRFFVGTRSLGAYVIGALHLLAFMFTTAVPFNLLDPWFVKNLGWPRGAFPMLNMVLYLLYAGAAFRRWTGRGAGWVAGRVAMLFVFTSVLHLLLAMMATVTAIALVV